MDTDRNGFIILMADDDDDDYYLLKGALKNMGIAEKLRRVSDGIELLDYLLHRRRFVRKMDAPRPSLILLDLNMPRMNGRQALVKIKSDPYLREIPVAIWSSSNNDEDKIYCQNSGAEVFMTKPSGYSELMGMIRDLIMQHF